MPPTRREQVVSCLRSNTLTILTMMGVIFGGVFGAILRSTKDEKWKARDIMYVTFIGELFLRMLKVLILPLIVSSLVSAIGSLDLGLSGRIGGRAVCFYMTTTVLAVVEGIILVLSIRPGSYGQAVDVAGEKPPVRNVTTQDTLMDLVRNMFPPNLVQACVSQYQTKLEGNDSIVITDWKIKDEYVSGTNILGLVVFATILGITLGKMGKDGAPLLNFFSCLGQCMMIITGWVIWLSPVGVFFLVCGKILEMDSFAVMVGQLGMYFMTVMIGLFIHGFVLLPTIYFLMTRKLPFSFVANMMSPLATAFGTASSSATMPVTIGALEDKNGVDPRVARFVIPIGSTINMDGTALYEAVAAIFISQIQKMSLSIGQLVAISITATAASIGAAGIPQAGLVTMVMVLDTVGLSSEHITTIIACDWLLDRFRTAINVLGDSLGAGIVHHLSRHELAAQPPPPGMVEEGKGKEAREEVH